MPAEEKETVQFKPAQARTTRYVVQAGDTLSKIAKEFYGDANLWPKIFEANKKLIKDPNLIEIGWELLIPPQ